MVWNFKVLQRPIFSTQNISLIHVLHHTRQKCKTNRFFRFLTALRNSKIEEIEKVEKVKTPYLKNDQYYKKYSFEYTFFILAASTTKN